MVEQPERFCSNCGHKLMPEDQFCSNCGMPVHRSARVPTSNADREVPPPPPPAQELGRRRRLTGSGALRGRGTKVVVVLVVGVLLLYLVLPLELLLSRIDRIQVRMEQATLQGAVLYNAEADLKGVNVSVPSLIGGNPTIETQSCSLSAEAPAFLINQNEACLSYLSLGAGY